MSIGGSSTYRPPDFTVLAHVSHACRTAEDGIAELWLETATPMVPVDVGVLRDSGRTGRDGERAFVTWGSDDDGGQGHAPSNQYAIIQHERTDLNHPNGGNALWGPISEHAIIPQAVALAHSLIGAAMLGRSR